jgi:hypothetical protein
MSELEEKAKSVAIGYALEPGTAFILCRLPGLETLVVVKKEVWHMRGLGRRLEFIGYLAWEELHHIEHDIKSERQLFAHAKERVWKEGPRIE